MMTTEQMDFDLAVAKGLFRSHPAYSITRCMHPAITTSSIWVFEGPHQIGYFTRLEVSSLPSDKNWRCGCMHRGQVISEREFYGAAECVHHIITFMGQKPGLDEILAGIKRILADDTPKAIDGPPAAL